MHVFLNGAGVVDRLSRGMPTRVLEIGLGLGLNCLLTADFASKHQTTLDYTGIEHEPISASQLQALNYQALLFNPSLVDDLAQLLAEPGEPVKLGDYTNVTLIEQDATSNTLLTRLAAEPPFDVIFLDAFSPEHNPECWTQAFFTHLHELLASDGLLATYCVKGTVRRNLQAAGFTVHKYPGPPGKREVLRALKKGDSSR